MGICESITGAKNETKAKPLKNNISPKKPVNNFQEDEKENMCALEYDIKKKGENAYYYAHKARFENNNADPNAKTITGPGIITGGVPVLLHTEQKVVENVKKPKSI